MKVTNIVSGRKIEIHRAIYNSQFDFYFGVNNDWFRYKYLDSETGSVEVTSFPEALNPEQYGIDKSARRHESVYITIGALRTEAGVYYRHASGQRNPLRLEGFPHLEISDATFEAVPTTNNPTEFLCVVIDGQLYTTDLCAYSNYRNTSFPIYGVNFAAQDIRFHDDFKSEFINQIRQSDSELVVGTFRGRYAIFENEEIARRYGETPSLGGYHLTTRSKDVLNDESVDWFVGFEVEKEDQEARNRCAWASSNLGNGWVVETDSSLDHRTGFEVVSPVFNLLDTKTMFDEFDRLDWVMNSGYSRRCGGHITISRRGVSAVDLIDKLAPFIPLLFSLYEGRLSTDYGGIQSKAEMKGGSRKAIFNCNFGRPSKDAVELRIFSAVSTLESIKFRTKLVQWIVKHIDNGTFTSFTEVADAMFTDKKLNKLLRSQYSAEKLARKQALVYVFGGCLEGQSPTEFLANSDNYERTLERMKRAYASVRNFTSRAVESKFGSHTIRKAIGQA